MKKGGWMRVAGCLAIMAAGCMASRQVPLAPEQKARLRLNQVSTEEAGITLSRRPDGLVVRWRELVRPEQPVQVPMVSGGNNSHQPMVSVRLNGGRTVPMVVDTGAPVNLLEADTALNNYVHTVNPDVLRHAFRGIAGTEDAWFGMVRQVTIGPELALRNVLTAIRGAHYERRRAGWLIRERWRGDCLGLSTLSQFAFIQWDYPSRTVTFSHREYWEVPASVFLRAPLMVTNGQWRVPIQLQDKEFLALVDTGSDAALMLSSNWVAALGWSELAAKGRREKYVGLGGISVTRRFIVPRMTLGGREFYRIPAVSGPEEFGVVLGSGFFHRYRLTIDLRRHKLFLEEPSRRLAKAGMALP